MHNLATVIKFEIIRTIKKPVFWVSVLSLPVIWIVFGFIGYSSQSSMMNQQEEQASESFSFTITDESKSVTPQLVTNLKGKMSEDKQTEIDKVKQGKLDAYYFIPKNLSEDKIEIYAKSEGFAKDSKYAAVISSILKNSSLETVDSNKVAIINSTFKTEETLYRGGQEYNPLAEMIIPGVFMLVFFMVIMLLSNQMLTSTTEEKENRVTEMILTSISSRTLIIGKIISLIIIGFIQILALVIPMIVGIIIASNFMDMSSFGSIFSGLTWDIGRIITSLIILIAGFFMFTGLLVGVGAAMPTAKDANGFFGVFIMLLMAPMFFIQVFMAPEPSFITHALSIFPLTSPISLLLQNTLGTLTAFDGIIGISVLVVSSVIVIIGAVKVFRYGTLAYGSKVDLKQVFAKK